MYHTSLRIKSDYFPEQLYPIGFRNESFLCEAGVWDIARCLHVSNLRRVYVRISMFHRAFFNSIIKIETCRSTFKYFYIF